MKPNNLPTLTKEKNRVHFIGIGGISMSGLAEILHKNGYIVSGSDWTASDITKHLANLGINVQLGNDQKHIQDDIDLVVYTAAVKPNNPEFAAAKQKNIPLMDRARLLGLIMEDYKYTIAVAGVHGKTTTTSIIAEMLLMAGLDPTISVGGFMEAIGSNFRIGNSPYFVLEACEYFDSFLQFYPYVGIILNIDSDHLDYFGSLERLVDSFRRFAGNIHPDGTLIIHRGTPFFEEVTAGLKCNIIAYGEGGRFWAQDIRYDTQGLPSFKVMDGQNPIAELSLKLRGAHNIDNSLAAAAVAAALNIPIQKAITGLSGASGTKRRFEYKGACENGAKIVDDYAHHPTEIKTTLSAAANGAYQRIICAFQPHTYSRTQNLLEEFSAAFGHSDIVIILPIYAAREVAIGPYPNYLAERLTSEIQNNGKEAYFFDSFDSASNWLQENLSPGDLLITMGAGDIYLLGERLISKSW